MWYAGNYALNSYWFNHIDFDYVWLLNNQWQLAMNSYYTSKSNRVVSVYTPTASDGSMLRKYENNGDYRNVIVGVSGTAKFLGGKLIANVRPQYLHTATTGRYGLRINEVSCSAQLTWYFGNFYLFGRYVTPQTHLIEDTEIKEHLKSRYMLQIGWSKGAWRANATAYNFLRSSWETTTQMLRGEYYEFDNTVYGIDQHRRFQISIAYTFNYGKKVQQRNEVRGAGTAESSILK